jgi:RNA polymerase sigma-70 factor (ECF subfamily)
MAVNSGDGKASNRVAREADSEIDRELIERAKSGDQNAFRKLVERHNRRAFVLAVALVRDDEDAREIVQEAFIRVHRGLSQFHGGSSFFTWLYRIVHNLSIDFIRRPARRELDADLLREAEEAPGDWSLELPEGNPLDGIHRSELQQRIRAALEELPPYHRGVIVMRELYGMSYEEMAESMGVSKGTIMSRLFHARKKLQKSLASCYEEAFGVKAPEEDQA